MDMVGFFNLDVGYSCKSRSNRLALLVTYKKNYKVLTVGTRNKSVCVSGDQQKYVYRSRSDAHSMAHPCSRAALSLVEKNARSFTLTRVARSG